MDDIKKEEENGDVIVATKNENDKPDDDMIIDDAITKEETNVEGTTDAGVAGKIDNVHIDETNESKTMTEMESTTPIEPLTNEVNGTNEMMDQETKIEQQEIEPKTEPEKSIESSPKKRKKSIDREAAETTAKTTTTSSSKRISRERKSVEQYNPDTFDKTDKTIQIIDGRGTAIKNLPLCVTSIESQSTDDITMVHKFLFTSRYKVSKKDMIQHILDFSGYLPKKDTSISKTEQEKIDDELESKLGAKAYKMTIPGLKKLCDFFAIDRHLTHTKEALVDKLLDFLGAPNKNKLKGGGVIVPKQTKSSSSSKKSKSSKKEKTKSKKQIKKKKKKEEEEEENDDDDADGDDGEVDEEEKDEEDEEEKDDEEDDAEEEDDNKDEEVDQEYDDVDDDKIKIDSNETPQLPNSDTLRKWVRAYVRCFHETKLTVNHALEIGSEKFGINLLPKKAELKKLLIEEL